MNGVPPMRISAIAVAPTLPSWTACGLRDYQVHPSQAHLVLPETLGEFRRRSDEALMDELIAIQAAAAMDAGLVSPAHLVIDPFPCEQRSQRVTDATTLNQAQQKRSS